MVGVSGVEMFFVPHEAKRRDIPKISMVDNLDILVFQT
jgi:hypothetical protein